MKKIYLAALAILWIGAAFYACKKANESNGSFNGPGGRSSGPNALLACTYETLSGNITANRTLSNTIIYKLDGCVTVKSGVTLTIPAGTVLQGMKAPTAGGKSFLIVERGGKLNAIGTVSNPVIFTSDQAPGSRQPGDWGGLRVFGQANNNNSNSLNVDLGCATYAGGGTNNTDNSGSIQYVQLHYAGAVANTNDISRAALLLNSVGTGTTVDHIQVTNPLNDGLAVFGGKVKLTNILSYNAQRMDYQLSYGYQGNMQFIGAMRLDAAAAPPTAAYGLNITNQLTGVSTNTPLTMPVISNLTVMGPKYCGSTTVNANFQYAVRFFNNGAAKIYNSVISSWNGRGIILEGPTSVAQTSSNNLEFSYNSLHNATTTPYAFTSPLSWSASGGCGTSIANWITGPTPSCSETGNEFSVATLGYDGSFCSNYCAAGFSQNFILGTTSLSAPNYSWDTSSAFSQVNYRGAFGSTDFSQGWTGWCPQNTVYCQ
ncbi:hypothetical protein [Pedobacter nutrimenti]|uniref:hypothetical protein n=1 Tax=Pedobacter nutrimenti TaxID=1241337 RepID=UPI00292CBFC3|nr:hypothetical protein [Pedobacter nutrimenti]